MPEAVPLQISFFAADGVVQVASLVGPVLTIGRMPDNGLTLADSQISRRHAELRVEDGVVFLVDVGSANGTFVEGRRLPPHAATRLPLNTPVRIGPYTLIVQIVNAAPPQEETEPDAAPPADTREAANAVVPVAAASAPPPPPEQTPSAEDKRGGEEPLPVFPSPLPLGTHSRYLRDLPAPFQDADFLGRFLLLFETVWEPLEMRQDHISLYFDPRTCPAAFLPYLAQWVGLDLAPHWPERRKRRLLGEATELYRWRGTTYGLIRFVELCVGVAPTVTEPDDEPFVLQITVPAPPGGGAFSPDDREAVRRVIETHKPAHVGYRLDWDA